LFVDLDANQLQSAVGDEGRIIPKKIQKALIAAITDETGWFLMMWYLFYGFCIAALTLYVFAKTV